MEFKTLMSELEALGLRINPESMQSVIDGEIKLTYKAYQELDLFMAAGRKMFHG